MKGMNDIGDNEIRVIGGSVSGRPRRPKWLWPMLAAVMTAVVAVVVSLLFHVRRDAVTMPPATDTVAIAPAGDGMQWFLNTDSSLAGLAVELDTVVDSIGLIILTPVNAVPVLHVGEIDTADDGIVLAAMAADVRRDNGKIVGAFVCAGEPLSWGLSKKGYCAIIQDSLTLGMADNSPLFERATDEGGYFFRQYAAVVDGEAVHNSPENRSMRRALCVLDGCVCIVGTDDRVLMDEFTLALQHLGVRDAVLLVGGIATAWWRDADGRLHAVGKRWANPPQNSSYIVFRAR